MNMQAFKLNALQIEAICDRIVPLIAAPADHGFFRGLISIKLESCSSGEAVVFVNKLLKASRAT